MKIGGAYTVPTDPQRAYNMLQDPDVLAKCIDYVKNRLPQTNAAA